MFFKNKKTHMILIHFILSVQAVAYQNWLCFDNAGHAQTTSDFSTALCTRNILAARVRFPFVWERIFFSFFKTLFVKKQKNNDLKNHCVN